MFKTIKARYDGRVFVPCEEVHIEPGTTVGVLVPQSPPPPTPEQQQEWEQLLAEIRASEPPFPTVDDAMRYYRKRP